MTVSADHLVEVRRTEQVIAPAQCGDDGLGAIGRLAFGVSGRFERTPLRRPVAEYGFGWYPLVALCLVGAADGLGLAALRTASPWITASTGISLPNGFIDVRLLGFAVALIPVVTLVQRGIGRDRLAVGGAVLAGVTLIGNSVATAVWGFVAMCFLGGVASAMVMIAGLPLLIDLHRPEARVRAFALYGGAVVFAMGAGVVIMGATSGTASWRVGFLILGLLALACSTVGLQLHDPGVGRWDEQRLLDAVHRRDGPLGASDGDLAPEEVRTSVSELLREVGRTRSGIPLVALAGALGMFVGPLPPYFYLFLRDEWSVTATSAARWFGVICLGAALGTMWLFKRGEVAFRAGPARLLQLSTWIVCLTAVMLSLAVSFRSFAVSIVLFALVAAGVSTFLPVAGVLLLSVLQPRVRPHASAFLGGAIVAVALFGQQLMVAIDTRFGVRWAFHLMALWIIGAVGRSLVRGISEITADLDRSISAVVETEKRHVMVSNGVHLPLLSCRHVDFSYGQLQVLFDVNFTVDDAEMVALLGTNGAGKSTMLRVVSGLGKPSRGTVQYRGSDITLLGPDRRVALGITQVPGGRAVFGPMSVVDNLRVFGYTHGRDRGAVDRGIEETFTAFPRLAERRNQLAGQLSGGEQQMLGLGKAFILRPRVLLIDELSLGLAPKIVGELLEMVRRINAQGVAVVLVEQSVNVALSLVDHAYFLEKGEVRYDGHASDLLRRGDLLRSVFLEGAMKGLASAGSGTGTAGRSMS